MSLPVKTFHKVYLFSFCSLQTLCLDGNFLTALPEELGNLQQLSSLGISFNNFSQIPEVYEKLTMLDKVVMAGNRLEVLNLGVLNRMSHIKHVDLRYGHLLTIPSLDGPLVDFKFSLYKDFLKTLGFFKKKLF